MSKENYDICSLPSSPLSVYLTNKLSTDEEYNGEISSSDESFSPNNFKHEVFSKLFNEMSTWTDDDDTSSIDSV